MKSVTFFITCLLPAFCQQQPPQKSGPAPIFQVTVVERTVKAVNYHYRSDPTFIDFRGTILLPLAKGEAVVQSKRGRTEIDAGLERLTDPQQFGREYLTYILWALTPDGRPHNLGEVVPNSHDKAHIKVTTDLQAFAMIVTVEPYSAVRQPSDVVVMENVVRPDTEGRVELLDAKYELLPRGTYVRQLPSQENASANFEPKVSMSEYEAISALYQAQNALGFARVAGADRYCPGTLIKAEQLFAQAQRLQHGDAESKRVVEVAREASETAEDARLIAIQHQQDDKLSNAQNEAIHAKLAARAAQAEVLQARTQAAAAQDQADEERAARQQALAEAAAAEQAPRLHAQAAQQPPPPQYRPPDTSRHTAARAQLLRQLNNFLPAIDTPRGLIATVPDSGFSGESPTPQTSRQLAALASVLRSYPELRVEVEGHTANRDTQELSARRAEAARQIFIADGVQPSLVSAVGLGNSRPIAPGGAVNQRIEIVISGSTIGNVATWDRTYSLR